MGGETFVATSIARRLLARMQATHDRRRISVFSGPPGIGKTTTINAFQQRHPTEVAVVKLGRRNAKEVLLLQHVLEAVRELHGLGADHISSGLWDLRRSLFGAICRSVGADPTQARRGCYDFGEANKLTIIFDEAQNLSREAIESLRYWNDPDRCYAPFPVGLVFVGNNEFSLASHGATDSVISAAVADRTLYALTFDYDDVSDDDVSLVLEAWGVADPATLRKFTRSFAEQRTARSLRRLRSLLEEATARPVRVRVSTGTLAADFED